MTAMLDLLRQGATDLWLFVPSAILLGALHGLEPGHSKTMMAAFIVAIQGTVTQAVLLGLSATASHTAVVWAAALAGRWLGQSQGSEANEPYFQLASAVLILAIALWMVLRIRRDQSAEHDFAHEHHEHAHGHSHHHDHDHAHEERHRLNTSAGPLILEVFEDGVPPRWRILSAESDPLPSAGDVAVTTVRPDGATQTFSFVAREGFLESVSEIPEPHAFTARLDLRIDEDRTESHTIVLEEHDHDHLDLGTADDAHALAHAADIRRRFAGRTATTGQIVAFGLTGGLIPCPAAITVLLVCMQLDRIALGVLLVVCFSVGLAVTMVSAGVVAALGVRHVASRWSGFGTLVRRAPYASAALIAAVGIFIGLDGWHGLTTPHPTTSAVVGEVR
ncbi:Inner membrane protein [Rhodovulum sp. PH10]|uniref:nickel/cobalt efflux transporter n=1 Tax=Rhodovulum sp. PH10 TaxID=1187851 RepID=UPI00027C2833|nr:nickel/cobalt efflux transporter [Rhodovulum sp. PH10]EJW10136.1 Inner membrane protein [Rhodovulum sp. PH10]